MKTTLTALTRTLAALTVVAGLAGCSDAAHTLVSPDDVAGPRPLTSGSYEVLDGSRTLTPGGTSAVEYTVAMPWSGPVYLTFNGRINYPYGTAGNSNVLEILVNGVPVSGGLTKGSTYTYPNRGGTESYYDNRSGGGYLWGLFWSPNFSANNTSSDFYYVQGANAYGYDFDISGYVNYGQNNTIKLTAKQGTLSTTPSVVLDYVWVRNY